MKFLINLFTTKKVSQNRFNICKNCEHYNSKFKICKLCGCFMWLKTKLLKANCPINKWSNPYNSWGSNA